jgi:DTW domain-containing protein YfiP
MVALAIENSRLIRGLYFDQGVIEKALAGQDAYLLFPGDSAKSCDDVALNDNSTVVVLDGTWSEAGKLLRRNPVLGQLPCLTFSTPILSNYRIRKQPKSHYLSTLESIGHLLIQNARAQGKESECENYQRLFSGFDLMVEQQLRYFPRMKEASVLLSS